MRPAQILRVMGIADITSAVPLLVAAGWIGDQVDLSTTAVRVVGAFLVVLGIETLLLRDKPVMAKVALAVEVLFALAAVDLAVLGDPTGIGVALLAGTALYGAAASVELAMATHTKMLVAS
jgi:hypothetical protein